MARKHYRQTKRRKSKFNATERFAFQMARVKAGLQNPDSRVSQSFQNGLKSISPKKPMF